MSTADRTKGTVERGPKSGRKCNWRLKQDAFSTKGDKAIQQTYRKNNLSGEGKGGEPPGSGPKIHLSKTCHDLEIKKEAG